MSDQQHPMQGDPSEANGTGGNGGTPEPLDVIPGLEGYGNEPTPSPKRPRRRRPRREPSPPLAALFDLDDPSTFGGPQAQP